ncbi:DUF4230 domain-containing protein [Rummeliibacillus pycnus]|uniref:DUF4230 domain-containing protein n=1 Tax=Rummeliibacillus pycnus TaxID=101070 RepID=UPI000C9B8C74|nr:DUF4230 domain-containing protein [Rummeliibacillus pycnus]
MTRKNRELEKVLKDFHMEEQQAATIMEAATASRIRFRNNLLIGLLKNWYTWIAIILIALLLILPFATWKLLQGNSFAEQKGSLVERIQNLNELTTAEAYTKVIIERQNNELFGKEIGIDIPGTKREILVVIPGGVKAGVDFSGVTEKNIDIDEKHKTATITLPAAKILGEPEIDFNNIQVFSSEGLFRSKPDMKEAYRLASDAKRQMVKEATTQGVLRSAEKNAKNSVADMFALVGYDVTVKFKE